MRRLIMKIYFTMTLLMLALNASANMGYEEGMDKEPDPTRLSRARSCFQELEVLGCGHPRDDIRHFKSCLGQSKDSLSSSCRGFMQGLYGK